MLSCARELRAETGVRVPEVDLGGGYAIAYTPGDESQPDRADRHGSPTPSPTALREPGGRGQGSPSNPVARSRARRHDPLHGRTVKPVVLDEGGDRHVRRRRRRHERQHAARHSTAPTTPPHSPRAPERPTRAVARRRQALRERRHRGARRRPARGRRARATSSPSPATGAYGRSMANNYNHAAAPARRRRAGRARA